MRPALLAAALLAAGCANSHPHDPVDACQHRWQTDVTWARHHTHGTLRVLELAQRRYQTHPGCSLTGG